MKLKFPIAVCLKGFCDHEEEVESHKIYKNNSKMKHLDFSQVVQIEQFHWTDRQTDNGQTTDGHTKPTA